jgi:hypothetical protein
MSRKSLLLLLLLAVVPTAAWLLSRDWRRDANPSFGPVSAEGGKARAGNSDGGRHASERPADGGGAGAAGPGAPAALPGDLGRILADDESLGSRARIQLLRDREAVFNNAEIESILAYLHGGGIPAGLRVEEWHWIVDEILTRLRIESTDPKTLTAKLAEVFANAALDPVVRDYALQHVGHLGREGGDAAVAHATALRGLAETGTPLAGTALLVLHHEPATAAGPDRETGDRALELINDGTASVPARVTALQVAARHHPGRALEAASDLLAGDAPVFLQVAAVAAIGATGSANDLPLLQSLPPDNPVLQRAVRAAIGKLTREP